MQPIVYTFLFCNFDAIQTLSIAIKFDVDVLLFCWYHIVVTFHYEFGFLYNISLKTHLILNLCNRVRRRKYFTKFPRGLKVRQFLTIYFVEKGSSIRSHSFLKTLVSIQCPSFGFSPCQQQQDSPHQHLPHMVVVDQMFCFFSLVFQHTIVLNFIVRGELTVVPVFFSSAYEIRTFLPSWHRFTDF